MCNILFLPSIFDAIFFALPWGFCWKEINRLESIKIDPVNQQERASSLLVDNSDSENAVERQVGEMAGRQYFSPKLVMERLKRSRNFLDSERNLYFERAKALSHQWPVHQHTDQFDLSDCR